MHVALAYDCLFPHTVGGAERWYRVLAEELLSAGHDVTYLTRRQWEGEADAPGMRVVAVSRGGPLYGEDGNRRIAPTLEYGAGVFRHLAAHRTTYDVVHAGNFPYFSVLGIAAARPRAQVGVDWHEVWSADYWRRYSGAAKGAAGIAVQAACIRATPRAFVFSALNERRLREEGFEREIVRLPGLYHGSSPPEIDFAARDPLVLFAGRLIPEKRAHLVPQVVALARVRVPALRGVIVGDGPERARVEAAIAAAGMTGVVEARGFVSPDELQALLSRAACLLAPSEREGYGMTVLEAAASATPSVVAAGPDTATPELIEEGVNGFVASEVEAMARAVLAAVEAGAPLRESTRAWFVDHAAQLSARESARTVIAAYER